LLAGAGATRFLAVFGAQVIRVEQPAHETHRWDFLRGGRTPDGRTGINLGGNFNNHNVEKLGITLNLRSEEGRALFLRLVEQSDVVTENFSAGVMERLALSYDDLRAVNERIVYVANSGFGKTGPYREYKTFGPVVQAIAGLTLTSGLPDQQPAGWGYSYMDHMGGYFMAYAVLAALVQRNRSGRGVAIDLSCTDAALGITGPELLDFTVNGRPVRAAGSIDSNATNHPNMAPHGIYPGAVADTWVAIACRDDGDFERLAAVVADDLASDARFADLHGRVAHRAALDAAVSAWTSRRDALVAQEELRAVGVPAAVVASPEQRIDHDPVTERWGLWPTAHHTEIGDVRVDGLPVHLSETDWAISRGAPCLGEHNRQVFGELLGLSDDDIDALAAAGVI
jgi:crotonobetainyl-CoA:carnitine CoA-transferase CaiB-like acyl-CoA transferase